MLLMLLGMLILPGIDAIAKYLSGSVSSGQVAQSRFLFQVFFMFPLLLGTRGPWWNSLLWLHAARGCLIAIATTLFFTGLAYLPLADAIAIFFIEPLLVTLLSAVFLGEHVGWRRLSAIAMGFVGAMIVIRPTFVDVGWAVLYPISTAFCFSFYILLTRKLVATEDPIRLQFFAGAFGLIVMSLALAAGTHSAIPELTASWPERSEWLWLAALGLIATSGHLLVVYAFRLASVGVLAPFQYVEIIGATLLGFIFFNDFPDPVTWIGISIIVGSGIYIFHRESRLGIDSRPGEISHLE
jgi:S-adenosylmethionine uptake transporter